MRTAYFFALGCLAAAPAFAQTPDVPSAQQMRQIQDSLGGRNCPGDPAGNLESFDCSFTKRMRAVEFFSTSVTDQALLGATFFGGIGYLWHRDPPEWGRGWGSAGRSIGSRYVQNFAKGAVTYAFSAAINTDPRNVSLAADPGFQRMTTAAGPAARVGHALLDWISVRSSSADGNGRRLPNLPLWAAATTSGLVGNAWLPDGTATTRSAVVTAGSSLATALAASFYTEFSPEVGRALGGLFKRGRTSSTSIDPAGRARAR